MAEKIGFDNNPAGSAVALGLGKVFKEWALKHTSGKANNLISKISTKSIGKALIYANVANAANQTVADFLPHVNAAITWAGALPANILNQTLGRIPVLGQIFRTLHNWITEAVSTIADFIGLDAIASTGRTFKLSDPNSGFETQIDWKTGKTGLPLPEDGQSTSTNITGDDTMNKKTNGKLINEPKFYGNLELHKTFTIPGAYTKKTVVNGTMATPKVVAHRIYENPMADASAYIDRLNQKYALIKAVRGLSATQYDIIDLANYERFAKMILLEYYVIKKVVQTAKTYSLVQVGIADNILRSLGFDAGEVRANLASYETLLCQIHRFISNNLPVSGTWIKRLEYLVGANIPDYNDAKVATIHTFSVSMSHVFVDRANPSTARVFDCIPNTSNNNYSVLLTNFVQYQQDLVSNTLWQQLIADYFGAFGAQAMWSDKDYPAYKNPLNLKNADNDLCREQVKNGMYLNTKFTVISIDAGVPNKKFEVDADDPTPIHLPNYQFGNVYDATTGAGSNVPTYLTILQGDCYLLMTSGSKTLTGLGATNKVLMPDKNGIGAQVIDTVDATSVKVSMNNHETIYTLHKDSYSEEESLEISQFKARSIGAGVYADNAQDVISIDMFFKTHEYALLDSTIYTFGSNGSQVVEQEYTICDESISDDDLTDTESVVDYPDEIMCWALVDWMPLAHMTFFAYFTSDPNLYSPRDVALIDMDAFGSLDDRAFATSINYSIYSLQAAGLAIGKKRVDNLGSVYKDKANYKD